MRNREINERITQQETKVRRYDNHRTNIPPVEISNIPEKTRTPTLTYHYHLWHNGQKLIIPKKGTQVKQQSDNEEYIDYPIEIKDYNHVYRGWNYPYELCNQEDYHSHIIKNKPKKQLRSWNIVAKSYINAKQAVEVEPAIYCHNRQEYDKFQERRRAESSSMGVGWVNSNCQKPKWLNRDIRLVTLLILWKEVKLGL